MITDSYGRTINYLQLAVTDRCNLRCKLRIAYSLVFIQRILHT